MAAHLPWRILGSWQSADTAAGSPEADTAKPLQCPPAAAVQAALSTSLPHFTLFPANLTKLHAIMVVHIIGEPLKHFHGHLFFFFDVSVQLQFVGCFTSQQHTSVSQGRICTDNFTCCHTEIEVADQTFYLAQSQYTDTGPTSLSTDPVTPGAWQGSHWSAIF